MKKGFTLAEVLITLGILGVVIAMTIPGLMQNIQDKQFKTAAKAAFSKASQAVQKMRLNNGDVFSTYLATLNFQKDLKPYFKIMQNCNYNSCVLGANPSTIYKTITGGNADTYYFDDGQFITTDGMFFGIESNLFLGIAVDVNGYLKGPNVYGRDVFMFQIVNNNLVPMGGLNTQMPASTYCVKSGVNTQQGLGCMEYVMEGKDY